MVFIQLQTDWIIKLVSLNHEKVQLPISVRILHQLSDTKRILHYVT